MCHYSLELVGMNKALNHTLFLYHYHPQRSGCNGESYDNACRAHSVGVSVSYMGYCAATTEPLPSDETIEDVVVEGWASNCRNNDQCPEDTKFCMLDMGNCEGRSGFGGCIARDQFAMCPMEYLPVW